MTHELLQVRAGGLRPPLLLEPAADAQNDNTQTLVSLHATLTFQRR